MSKLILGIVALIIIATGGYYVYTNYSSPAMENKTENTTPQDQVQVQDVTVGEGTEAAPGMVVSVLYRGQLEDGTVFDSSEARGNKPLVFTLGQQGLIPGFQIGINGMKVGGERIMVIPPSLAYGEDGVKDPDGNVVIPPNAKIVFNVALTDVQAAPESTSTATSSDATSR